MDDRTTVRFHEVLITRQAYAITLRLRPDRFPKWAPRPLSQTFSFVDLPYDNDDWPEGLHDLKARIQRAAHWMIRRQLRVDPVAQVFVLDPEPLRIQLVESVASVVYARRHFVAKGYGYAGVTEEIRDHIEKLIAQDGARRGSFLVAVLDEVPADDR